jgi:hypothetical protein
MLLNIRHGSIDSESYRYDCRGQERDDEVKGEGNSYKYRMHDVRPGRFFAVDPIDHKYSYYTPYQFSGNKVIHAVELEGLEERIVINSHYLRDAIINYMSCNQIILAIGAARNAAMWESEESVNWAQQTFSAEGQYVGQSSGVRTNGGEFDTKGIEVYSYNNEGEMYRLFSATVEVDNAQKKSNTPLLFTLIDVSLKMAGVDLNDFHIKPGNAKDSSSNSDQGGITLKVRGSDSTIGGNTTTGNPDDE